MAMRRINRSIEVFDISLMAVVTKAMGAFLVMMLLLLPYYRSDPDFRTSTVTLRAALAGAEQELERMRIQLANGKFSEDPAELRSQLAQARQSITDAVDQIDRLARQTDAIWSQLQQARALVAQLKVQLANAQSEIAKAGQLQGQYQNALQNANLANGQMRGMIENAAPSPSWWEIIVFRPNASCTPGALALSVFGGEPIGVDVKDALGESDVDFKSRASWSMQINMPDIKHDGPPGLAPPATRQSVLFASRATEALHDYVVVRVTGVVSDSCAIDAEIAVHGKSDSTFTARNLHIHQPNATGEPQVLVVLFSDQAGLNARLATAADQDAYRKDFAAGQKSYQEHQAKLAALAAHHS